MKLRLKKLFSIEPRGFTLVETIAALAIAGLVGLGATIANAQVMNQTARNNAFTTASRHTLNALQWISRDVQMSQDIDGDTGFPETSDLTLTWVEWDNTVNQVVYSLEDGELKRTYTVDGGDPTVTLVAEYINSDADLTNCVSDNGVLTLTITGTVGVGSKAVSVTKTSEITSRPKL
jgi:prepilin-type N-terminal cleavage/methylation domain-containing protein